MFLNRRIFVWALLPLACLIVASCNNSPKPIGIGFSTGAAVSIDQGQSLNISVQLTNDTKMLGVTWSLVGAGSLTNQTKTSVTYTAPAGPLASPVTDHLTAASLANVKTSATLAITVNPPPTIIAPFPADGVNGTAYSQQVTASGGVGTLGFTISAGALPAGLIMNSSGLISGTPSGSNVTANFTVTVSDQSTGTPPATGLKALSIHIAPAPVLSITTTSLKNGTTNIAYSDAVVTTGGVAPVTFSITSGALPHGLSLNANTGAITGTPDTTANNFGTFNFTVQATDKAIPPQTPSKALSITIMPPALSITNTNLPGGQVGISYSGKVQTSGGFPPLVFSVSLGSLPTGLTLNANTGAITGMPTVANQFLFTIKVVDAAAQVASQAYGVTIAPPISVALTTPPPANLQATLTAQVAATVTNDAGNLGVDWSVTCGSASCGSFSPTHTASGANTTYTAPAAVPTGGTVTITAKSTADPTKSASGVTTITPPPIIVTFVLAPPSSLQVGNSVMVSAHVANDGTSAGVDWTVTCGSASCGSFSVAHTATDVATSFTAPASVPTGNTVTIKAASTADGTKFVSAATTITTAPPIVIVISTAPPSSMAVNASAPVSATVTNDSMNKGVDWTVTCGSASCGSFNPTHTASGAGNTTTYTAPAAIPTGGTVTIKATSTADITQSVTVIVTITGSNPNNAKLNGNYAFVLAAWDNFDTFSPAAVGGSFIADGNGNLTSGVLDRSFTSTLDPDEPFTGTYNIGNDGRGTLNIVNPGGGLVTYTIRFALQSNGNAKIIAFGDTSKKNLQGSGVIKKQTTSDFALPKITGDYALGIEGVRLTNNDRSAAAGRFTTDGAGGVTTGTIDISSPSSSSGVLTLGGAIAAPDATTGRGTLAFTVTGGVTITLAYYIVSANELLVLDIDSVSRISYTGVILTQKRPSGGFTLASFNSTVVFEFTGYDVSSTQSNTGVGFITADGAGNLTNGFLDENADGSFQSSALPAGLTYTIDSNGNGRGILLLNGGGTHQQVLYFVDVNKVFFLEGTTVDVGKDATLGFAEPQSAGITSASFTGNYAFGTGHPVTPFVPNFSGEATATGATGTFAGTEDISLGQSGVPATVPDLPISATYSFTAGQNGRATATVTPQGTSPVHLVFWFISPSKVVGVNADAATTNSAILFIEQ